MKFQIVATIIHKISETGPGFHVEWRMFVFVGFFVSIGEILVLAGGLGTRL